MNLEIILGKIIELTKNIYLKVPKEDAYKHNFLIDPPRLPLISFELWFSKKGREVCEEIALMSIQYDSMLKNGDIDSFREIIEEIFKENIFNEDLFDYKLVFPPQKNTLFEVINTNIKITHFAKLIWNMINRNLILSLKNWAIIYPLSKISTKSFSLGYDGISLIKFNDEDTWDKFTKRYNALKYWDPKIGKTMGSDRSIFSKNPPDTWLLCEVNGTLNGARKQASILMKKFIGVLLSYIFKQKPNIINHSSTDEVSYSMQVSSDENSSYTYSHIGVILYSLLVNIKIDNNIISEVKDWYKKQSLASDIKAHRASKAAQFIQYGLAKSFELDKFIYYFIALDALFGKAGKVEDSIVEGILKIYNLDLNKTNIDRVKKLYKLRSDLVHGGSSYIEEWDGIIDYRRHFKSKPLSDVQKIAMEVLIRFFDI